MNSLKSVFSICAQNFRKWQTDYRVWCIALLVAVMAAIYVDDMRKITQVLGSDMPVWIFPFMYSQFHTKLIYTLPLVLLFCNAPFIDGNQTFVFMRSGRAKWLWGQILYIALSSALYYLFIFVVSMLLTIPYGGFSAEWGGTLTTISVNGSVVAQAHTMFVDISRLVIIYFTPLQAVWFTFVLSWLGGIFLGLLVFACNFLSSTKWIGSLAASVVVVASSAVENDGWEKLMPFSPVSWITLDNVDVGGMTTNPSFTYCICVFAALIAILSAIILIFGRKHSLDIRR